VREVAQKIDSLKATVSIGGKLAGLAFLKSKKYELIGTHTAMRSFATSSYKNGFQTL
jgi:hypothetical protein